MSDSSQHPFLSDRHRIRDDQDAATAAADTDRAYECFKARVMSRTASAYAGVSTSEKVIGYRLPRSDGRQRHLTGLGTDAQSWSLASSQGVLPRIEAGCPGSGKLATFVNVSPSSRRMSMSLSTKFAT